MRTRRRAVRRIPHAAPPAKAAAAGRETPIVAFRNRRGERVDAAAFTATEAKNAFGRALDIVRGGGVVVITSRDTPRAVLVSVDEFNALARNADRTLDALTAEFDAMLARMQTSAARAGMRAAFDAPPDRLGRAAVAAARKRG